MKNGTGFNKLPSTGFRACAAQVPTVLAGSLGFCDQDEASRGGGGGGPGGVIGSLSGLLERSLFGGGGATSSRGRLSQGRLSHQLGSLGGGKIQSDLNSAKNIFRWGFCGTRQSSCSK